MKFFWKLYLSIMLITITFFSIGGYFLIQSSFHNSLEREIESVYKENDIYISSLQREFNIPIDDQEDSTLVIKLLQNSIGTLTIQTLSGNLSFCLRDTQGQIIYQNGGFSDKNNFIDKVEWKEAEKKDYVLYFGRFSKEKGIGTLIEVCKKLPDVQFIFAGTGPLEEEINGISNIKNVGFQKGEALEKLIREARFSIYPSEWYENCPFSVMESQMYGTPVLGANIGGIPELISVGKTGELFESGNGEDLKSKIDELWNDKEKLDKYSENCKDISFDTIEEYCNKLIKIYE